MTHKMAYLPYISGILISAFACHADEASQLASRAGAASTAAHAEAAAFMEALRNQKPETLSPKALKDIPLPNQGKGGCKGAAAPGKCASTLLQDMERKRSEKGSLNPFSSSKEKNQRSKLAPLPQSHSQLLVFVSSSMPEASLKGVWKSVHKVGGKLVLRGLVGGTFKGTQSYIQDLGIVADIDPTKFEEFKVKEVPTFILHEGGQGKPGSAIRQDRLMGNVSVKACLEEFGKSGDLKEAAVSLLQKLEAGQ